MLTKLSCIMLEAIAPSSERKAALALVIALSLTAPGPTGHTRPIFCCFREVNVAILRRILDLRQ